MYDKNDRDKGNDPKTDKKKNRNFYFFNAYSCYLSTSIYRVIDRKKQYIMTHSVNVFTI